jgi:hypothetical protein
MPFVGITEEAARMDFVGPVLTRAGSFEGRLWWPVRW